MSDSSTRRRVPAFTPVPLRYRRDGWTPGRQADFLGHLAETLSVAAAARHVGKSRESAYRLHEKPGAESFAAAWDSVLAQRPAAPMSTHEQLWHCMVYGTLKPIMRGGKHVATRHSPDNDAVLRLYRRKCGAAARCAASTEGHGEKSLDSGPGRDLPVHPARLGLLAPMMSAFGRGMTAARGVVGCALSRAARRSLSRCT